MRGVVARFVIAECTLALLLACDDIGDELPPVAEVLGYDVVKMDWPWCPVEPPPVRADFDVCPVSELGSTIDPKRVCQLLTGLKDWMEEPPASHPPQLQPGDWFRIRSMIVCGWGIRTTPSSAKADEVQPVIHIEADVPQRPRLYWAELEEDASPPMRFGAVHR